MPPVASIYKCVLAYCTVTSKDKFSSGTEAQAAAADEAATATCELEADTLHKANSVRDSFEAQELERMQNEADAIDGAEKFTAPGGKRRRRSSPSRHRRASSPSDGVVGGLYFDFEPVRENAIAAMA